MRRRCRKGETPVGEKLVTLEVVGGEDNTLDCTGFKMTADGLAPLHSLSSAVTVTGGDAAGVVICLGAPASGKAFARDSSGNVSVINVSQRRIEEAVVNAGGIASVNVVKCADGANYSQVICRSKLILSSPSLNVVSPHSRDVKAAIVHCGRVYYVTYGSPTVLNWTEGATFPFAPDTAGLIGFGQEDSTPDGFGDIALPAAAGSVVGMAELNSRLVIVRERGVTVLRALSDPRNFALEDERPYAFYGPVNADSVAVCDGKVWFTANTRLYYFDGEKVDEAALSGRFRDGFTKIDAVVSDNRHTLFMGVRSGQEKYLVEYDVRTGRWGKFASGGHAPFAYGDKVMAFRDGQLGTVNEGVHDYNRSWTSKPFTFNGRVVTLKSVNCSNAGTALRAIVDGNHVQISADGGPINIRGRSFAFVLYGDEKVEWLKATWRVSL